MTFLAGIIVTTLAVIYVLMPLFREPKGNLEVELLAETELDRLLNRKAIIYSNLKDLEFEHKMGRLGEADFRRLEAGFKSEAAVILQNLDTLGVEDNLDARIEQDIAARKAKLEVRDRRSASIEPRICPSCGAEAPAGKK